jgi:hypothetical protein
LNSENRTEFFNRTSCFLGLGVNSHPKYRFVIVMIMAMQVANHEPLATYKTLAGPPPSHTILNYDPRTESPLRIEVASNPSNQSNPSNPWQSEQDLRPRPYDPAAGDDAVDLQCGVNDCLIF